MSFPVRAATILTHSPSKLTSHLLAEFSNLTNKTCLFALSTNLPPDALSKLTSRLSSLSSQSVGWLSAPLPREQLQTGAAPAEPRICLSLAFFNNSDAVPFRSEIAGKAPVQVGKWHATRDESIWDNIGNAQTIYEQAKKDGGKVNWEDVWASNVKGNVVPVEFELAGKERIGSVIFASDNASEGLTNALATLPNADILGQVATSTPFVTGRPVTMFHNGSIHSKGAVGLALLNSLPSMDLEFPTLQPVTKGSPYTLTRAEGNLVITLDDRNPTQTLLKDIKTSGGGITGDWPFKDDLVYYLAVVEGPNDSIKRVYEIISGDPARGSLALASDKSAPVGSSVKFFQSPTQLDVGVDPAPESIRASRRDLDIGFVVSEPQGIREEGAAVTEQEDLTIIEDTFLSSSENGIILGERGSGELAWRCTAVGSVARLRF